MTTDLLDRLRASLATTYDFERELGGGGMSRVFVAGDTRLGRKIVVKVLNPELAEGISAQRFEREIQIAARLDRGGSTITQLGTALGTPAYMAPEQAAGDTDIDQRADLYAWGVLAYECLTHAHPFADKKTARALITAHLVVQPTPISERVDVGAAVADIVMRCLAKDPHARPRSARALLRSEEHTSELQSRFDLV